MLKPPHTALISFSLVAALNSHSLRAGLTPTEQAFEQSCAESKFSLAQQRAVLTQHLQKRKESRENLQNQIAQFASSMGISDVENSHVTLTKIQDTLRALNHTSQTQSLLGQISQNEQEKQELLLRLSKAEKAEKELQKIQEKINSALQKNKEPLAQDLLEGLKRLLKKTDWETISPQEAEEARGAQAEINNNNNSTGDSKPKWSWF